MSRSVVLRHSVVARELGVSEDHVRKLVAAGELGSLEGGITREDLADFKHAEFDQQQL